MAFQETITDPRLDAAASVAASSFLDGTSATTTDAVVKAASTLGPSITDEHVRRLCEKTYREVFERMHKAASGDRNVVFDPPDAKVAAERLTARKVAAARASSLRAQPAGEAEKAASAPDGLPKRFEPVNVFDLVTKAAAAPVPVAGIADLQFIVRDMRHTVQELEGKKEAAAATVQITLLDLLQEAKECVADGISVDDVVVAGAQGVVEAHQDIPEQYVEKAAELLVRGLVAAKMSLGEKVASAPTRVNGAHPLVARYAKLASALFEHEAISIGLDVVRPEFRRARDGLLALSPA